MPLRHVALPADNHPSSPTDPLRVAVVIDGPPSAHVCDGLEGGGALCGPLSPFRSFSSPSPPLADACSGSRSARDATTDPTRVPSGVRFSMCSLAESVSFRSESASDRVGRPTFTFPPPPSSRPSVPWSIGCRNLVSLSALTKTVTCS